MTVVREQSALGTWADPSVATFGSTPTEGNLLVVEGAFRSTTSTMTISGSGWTKRLVDYEAETGNGTYQRTLTVWSKDAGASEPTAITVDSGSAANAMCLIQEFSGVSDADFSEIVGNDDGQPGNPSTDVTLISGTTSSLASATYFTLSAWMTKTNPENTVYTSFTLTNDLASGIFTGDESVVCCSGFGEKVLSGAQTTTGTVAAATVANRGHIHAFGVWTIPSAAGSIINQMQGSNLGADLYNGTIL